MAYCEVCCGWAYNKISLISYIHAVISYVLLQFLQRDFLEKKRLQLFAIFFCYDILGLLWYFYVGAVNISKV